MLTLIGAVLLVAISMVTTMHLWDVLVMPLTGWSELTYSSALMLGALVAVFNDDIYYVRERADGYFVLGCSKYIVIWAIIGVAHLIK